MKIADEKRKKSSRYNRKFNCSHSFRVNIKICKYVHASCYINDIIPKSLLFLVFIFFSLSFFPLGFSIIFLSFLFQMCTRFDEIYTHRPNHILIQIHTNSTTMNSNFPLVLFCLTIAVILMSPQ